MNHVSPAGSTVPRRTFLKTAASATTWAGIQVVTQPQRVFGANEKVRVAVLGVRGRGWDLVQGFWKLPDAEVAALCDVDRKVLTDRAAQFEKARNVKPSTFSDPRKVMEDKSIDAVAIATPNHWHSLLGIWACQAGKDVYVEKPMSHRWFEGRQLVEAARKYKRIVMHGSQSRCSPALKEAVQKMREGLIGELYLARGLCYKRRKSIGKTLPSPVPEGVDYDLWTGPAPLKPFTQNRFHYNWHWFWDYGDGDFGNQGVHQLDIARWGLGVTYPNRVAAIGGKAMFDDDQETPNVLNVAYEFSMPDGKKRLLVFEVRHWLTNHEAGIGTPLFGEDDIPAVVGAAAPTPPPAAGGKEKRKGPPWTNVIGNLFYGSDGYLAINGYTTYKSWLGENHEPGPEGRKGGDYLGNFIAAVRSRRPEDVDAPIEEGHISCTLLHLGNIAYRLGRVLQFDPEKQAVIGDDEANRMLKGEYRAPFTVPEQV